MQLNRETDNIIKTSDGPIMRPRDKVHNCRIERFHKKWKKRTKDQLNDYENGDTQWKIINQ